MPSLLPMIRLRSAEGKRPVKNKERMEFGRRRVARIEMFALIAYGAPRAAGGNSKRDGDGDALTSSGGCQRGEPWSGY